MEQDDLKQSAKPRKKKSATTADTVSWTKKRTRKKSVSTKTTKKTQENIVNEIALSATPDPLLVESTTQDLWIQNINDYITTMKQRRSDTPLQHTSIYVHLIYIYLPISTSHALNMLILVKLPEQLP
jgi:hypothetical protein